MNFIPPLFRNFYTPEEKKQRIKELILCISSGILAGISFPPFKFPYFIFIALIPYFFVISKRKTLAEINRATYLTAFVFTLVTLYWVGSWTKDADPFLQVAGTALMFFNPLVFLIASTVYYFSRKIFKEKISLFLLPFFWVTYEYWYSLTDLKFPWLTLGNSLPYAQTFIQIADVIGVYGLSLFILFVNIFLFLTISGYLETKKINKIYAGFTLLFIALPFIYGSVKLTEYRQPESKIKAGLIQPNLNPWKKWEEGSLDEQLDNYLKLSEKSVSEGAKIIFWPESALPVYLMTGPYEDERMRIRNFVQQNRVDLFTGMPDATFYFDPAKVPDEAKLTASGKAKYVSYNSVLHFTPGKYEVEKYGKINLVPFGEKAPFIEYIPFLGKLIQWEVGISSWNVGKDTTVFHPANKASTGEEIPAACVVCIESIYPDFIARFVEKGAKFIAVVTNDSWYGKSSGPYQHKEISVLRAVENRRTVVRAANGGISCIIDPSGKIISETELFTRTELTGDIYINSELTFYSGHPLLVPITSVIISILVILIFLILKLRDNLKFRKFKRMKL